MVLLFVMVFYEFFINVLKYGVLLNEEGYVEIFWDLEYCDGMEIFIVCWWELNGLCIVNFELDCKGFGLCFIVFSL